ncbi:MAG: pentapeptide repeat-containing protein [Bradymonadia bacterium]
MADEVVKLSKEETKKRLEEILGRAVEVDKEGRFLLVAAVLSGAHLEGAHLEGAHLEGAHLKEAHLEGAHLKYAHLDGANLEGAHLDGADLLWAHLKGANLLWAHLEGACLEGAHLEGAHLKYAHLDGAHLAEAHLNDADLRGASGFIFDSTCIRSAKIDPHSRDPWSIIRRNYTGPMMMFHLLLLLAFIIPLGLRTAMLVGVNKGQEFSEQMLQSDSPATLKAKAVFPKERQTKCLQAECREEQVWYVLLGFDKDWATWVPAILVLLYNLIRGFLTWRLAPMRDEEERSHVTPAWKGERLWEGYYPLYQMHRIASVLLWVGLSSGVLSIGRWLMTPVWIPA